jgi:hypothetical protein
MLAYAKIKKQSHSNSVFSHNVKPSFSFFFFSLYSLYYKQKRITKMTCSHIDSSLLQQPLAFTQIHKEECTQCFDNQVKALV